MDYPNYKQFLAPLYLLLLGAIVLYGCIPNQHHAQSLASIDKMLNAAPAEALDSLSAMDVHSLSYSEKAYYNLLFTIAQHKNHIPFTNDSAIAFAHQYFQKQTEDYYNQARSGFYLGLVLYKLSSSDERAYSYMREAANLIQKHAIDDNRLSALLYAFLGRINDHNLNYEEAISFFQAAVEAEKALGNQRNLILDYCDLIVALTRVNSIRVHSVYQELEHTLDENVDIHLENVNNTKAIYYLHADKNLDSAYHYCMKWKPAPSDKGAQQRMLASICQEMGKTSEAIAYEKAAYASRRPADSLSYHIFYRNLADLYEQLGDTDSTAHYAQLAYKALHDSFEQKTEKRILELEKQYDVASRVAAIERERRVRNVALLLLAFALVIAALLFWQWRLMRRNEALRQREALKDAVAKSIVNAVVATYSGINKRLAVIHNLPDKERQDALNSFIQENKMNTSRNLLAALESNYNDLPEDVRQVDAVLDGAQQRAVFILTEMGFGPGEIGKMLGISSSQVRTVKTTVRDRIVSSDLARLRSIRQLQVMQVGTPVRKKE